MSTTFNVYRNGTLITSGLTSPGYTDTGLTDGVAYSYQVSATVNGVEGLKSSATTATPSALGGGTVVAFPTGTIAQFPAGGPPAAFLTLMADMTIDVIEMAAGTYVHWNLWFNIDRTSRPLLIRPAAGAAVVFSGSPVNGSGLLYPGWISKTAYITFDPAGTGGSFEINGYGINSTALVAPAWVDHFAANGFLVRNCTASAGASASPWQQWVVYSSGVVGTGSSNASTFNDWEVHLEDDPYGYVQGAVVAGYIPTTGVTMLRWKVTASAAHKPNYACYAEHVSASVAGVDVESWTITNCNFPFTANAGVAGTVKNMTSTGCGAPSIGSPFVDGGGNSWA